MSKLSQMRMGIKKLIEIDKDIGVITRAVMEDNGRGQMISTDEASTHQLVCRVSYQSGGVWPGKQWEGGLTINTTPFILAYADADLQFGDTLEWRGKRYSVGVVTKPEIEGKAVCVQAPLTEVK